MFSAPHRNDWSALDVCILFDDTRDDQPYGFIRANSLERNQQGSCSTGHKDTTKTSKVSMQFCLSPSLAWKKVGPSLACKKEESFCLFWVKECFNTVLQEGFQERWKTQKTCLLINKIEFHRIALEFIGTASGIEI